MISLKVVFKFCTTSKLFILELYNIFQSLLVTKCFNRLFASTKLQSLYICYLAFFHIQYYSIWVFFINIFYFCHIFFEFNFFEFFLQVANACSDFMRSNLLWTQSQSRLAGLPLLTGRRPLMLNGHNDDRGSAAPVYGR